MRSARGVARAVAQLNTGRTVRRGETLAAPSGAATHVALAVAPQQRPPAVRSTPPTGASRTPSLCGGFCNALTMLCATTRQLHGHDRVVLHHVERRPPAPQPRRDRAAARPRTIARPHPLYDFVAVREIIGAVKVNVPRLFAVGALLQPFKPRRTASSTAGTSASDRFLR